MWSSLVRRSGVAFNHSNAKHRQFDSYRMRFANKCGTGPSILVGTSRNVEVRFGGNTRRPFSTSILSNLLSNKQKNIIVNERLIFDEILVYLKQLEAEQSDIDIIIETKSRVDDVFLVVIVGEFNAGKSTFINALLGENHLKVGVLPTTSKIGILRSTPTSGAQVSGIWRKSEKILMDDVEELDLPVDWLQHVALIDTPGTNAVIEKHEALTMKIVPRSDLILFVTSAERPITDSEKSFLMNIQKWGKKVIVVVNKIDLLRTEDDQKQVLSFVSQNVGAILGSATPIKVFGVSSIDALTYKMRAAKEGIDPAMAVYAQRWLDCGISEIEAHLKSVLGKEELVRNKLLNPLTLGDRILAAGIEKIEVKLLNIESDMRLLTTIETVNAQFNVDLDRDLELYLARIKSIMQQIMASVDQFIDTNVTFRDPRVVWNTEQFMQVYHQSVVLDLNGYVSKLDTEMCEQLAKKAKEQSMTVLQYLGPRTLSSSQTSRQQSTNVAKVPLPNVAVQDARIKNLTSDLLAGLNAGSKAALSQYDHKAAVSKVSSDMRNTIVTTSAMSGVLAVGSTTALLAQTLVAVDPLVGGVTTAASLAIGAATLPAKKQAIRKEMSDRLQLLSSQLQANLNNNFIIGKQQINDVLQDAVAPYSRMLRAEKESSIELIGKMSDLRVKIREIRSSI